MSFWSLSSGENAIENVSTDFEVEGGNLDPIPEGSHVLATIDAARWNKTQTGNAEFAELTWTVIKPDEYRNRKIFHKLWVSDLDPNVSDIEKAKKKRDRNVRMLATIDANSGGRLAKINEKPSDDQLSFSLVSNMMVISLGEYETPDGKRGNWVRGVFPKNSEIKISAPKNKTANKPAGNSSVASQIDDEIPF